LFFSSPPASADAFSVVVDQLELAAAAGGGFDGCGVAAAACVVGAGGGGGGAGWGGGAGAGAGAESLTEPNQRVKRFPLRVAVVVLLGGSAFATEVLQAPRASLSPGVCRCVLPF